MVKLDLDVTLLVHLMFYVIDLVTKLIMMGAAIAQLIRLTFHPAAPGSSPMHTIRFYQQNRLWSCILWQFDLVKNMILHIAPVRWDSICSWFGNKIDLDLALLVCDDDFWVDDPTSLAVNLLLDVRNRDLDFIRTEV